MFSRFVEAKTKAEILIQTQKRLESEESISGDIYWVRPISTGPYIFNLGRRGHLERN